jgi:hypothetical protein
MAYSPMAVFYNQKTTEGVGFVVFDGGLEQRTLSWISGPGTIHPYVTWNCEITGGKSETTTMQEHHAFNMPTEAFQYYRDTFLVPFMQSEGISEGKMAIVGVIGHSIWPPDSDLP